MTQFKFVPNCVAGLRHYPIYQTISNARFDIRRYIAAGILLFPLAACSIPLKITTGQELCVQEWSKAKADKAAMEADMLPPDSVLREILAEHVDIRNKAKRC